MKHKAASSNQATNAPEGITWLELGEIQNKHELGIPLTKREQATRQAALETSDGEGSTRGIMLARAKQLYVQHLEHQVQTHGGSILTETHRVGSDGRRSIERRIRRFTPRRGGNHAPVPASRPRGAGRPKVRGASRRSSARSGDGGSEDGESEPPPRRLCAACGKDIPADRSPKAEHCTNKCAANDRQRRKRQRDRERRKRQPVAKPRKPAPPPDWVRMTTPPDPVEFARLKGLVICGCNGRHQEFEPGQCHRCGHRLPRGAA